MRNTFTHGDGIALPLKKQKVYELPVFIFILFFLFFLQLTTNLHAQEVMAGLTSNGGPAGRGTAFTIKTNGTSFGIISGFADWGKTPNGDLLKGNDGNFYGMTSTGGTFSGGTIFRMTPVGEITILRQLNPAQDGSSPNGELIKGTDGFLYGVTSAGGTNSYGTIFKISTDGSVFTVLRHFAYATDGANPKGHLVQAKDGNFYGLTYGGGANGYGTIFKITPAGAFTLLRSLNKTTDGGNSYGSLTEGKDGNLYGLTYWGGTYNYGTIFKIAPSGASFAVVRHLNSATDGGYPQSDLIVGSDGNFYGNCYGGGTYGNGTIFKLTTAGVYTVLRHLASSKDGGVPYGNLMQNTDGFLYGLNRTGGLNTAGTVYKISTTGTYTVLHSFVATTEGTTANGGLARGDDGNLYGMTSTAGPGLFGTAFKVTTAGALTVLASFWGAATGNAPLETMVKGKDSAYYGTNSTGGAYNYGAIFKICGGKTTTLFSFNRNVNGGLPKGSLIQATDGNFYGMASEGGTSGHGTIFKITPTGSYTVIRHLNSPTDGGYPQGSLVQLPDGNLYGMTNSGGTNGGGTIFKITTTGTFTVLRHLKSADDGANPEGNLVKGADGALYGMTLNNPKIFKITTSGTFTILRALVSTTDGAAPAGSLVLHSDGNFYGTTSSGGTYSGGTIFKISATGTFKTLKHLNNATDGRFPKGTLLIGTDNNLYGMTSSGGTYGAGTLFKITTAGTYTILRHFNMVTDGGAPTGGLIPAPINNLVANAQSITTAEDKAKAVTLTGSGGSPLTFNIAANPARGKISGTGANRTYTPNANYAGADQFSFTVSVGCLTSPAAIVSVTVTPVPDTPVLAAIGAKSVVVNTTLTFTAKGTDPDAGQILTYSLIGAPSGATINSTTGAFSWKPAAIGNFTFKVRVTDNGSPALYDEETITVTVKAAAVTAMRAISEEQLQPEETEIKAVVFPNPATSLINLKINTAMEDIVVSVVDMKGVVLSKTKYNADGKNNIQLDVSGLKSGNYFIQVQSKKVTKAIQFTKG
ncbi:Ig-like domain-containing protein [Danxiaibacter flavus]|uniref:Ig-like domain-containing protein n=1 Tax=Danxiaibacter flavus TaxID=3049108 RepID=A0ABV3ZB13_9BACT|nr:Ig-like domain-containing protein [Chitinophagaceae bacterium DXS]